MKDTEESKRGFKDKAFSGFHTEECRRLANGHPKLLIETFSGLISLFTGPPFFKSKLIISKTPIHVVADAAALCKVLAQNLLLQ